MSDQSNELNAWDRDHFLHPVTHLGAHARGETPNRIISGGEGVYITDTNGRRTLDAFAGLYCVNIGYGRQEIAAAIAQQASELAYYHAYAGHGTKASITLAKMIIDRAPKGMSRVYFGLSGSDANETAVKLIWYYNNALGRPEKKKIIARWRGYHGSGLMTGSLTGLDIFHKAFDLPLQQVVHMETPYYLRRADRSMDEEQYAQYCADKLEELILAEGPETIAAFIGEPVLGTGGIIPPPAGYWQKIRAVLSKYDILLVADEIVTGFGRMGTMFGSQFYEFTPDIMTLAKGVTSAYAPLSATVVSDEVWQGLLVGAEKFGPLGHGWTYSAHPICAAAGVANLQLIDELGLVENAASSGAYLLSELRRALGSHKHVAEIRGAGLLAAIEFVEDKDDVKFFDPAARTGIRIATALLERGVIGRAMPQSDTLGFAPPLCLRPEEADEIVQATVDAVEAVFTDH